ncbi:MAG: preprotein translocase subunit SecA [Microscillaceae bacterium]|jgi:preprotein translocase subunit SecA|nr:preprotein translocase subunit SecA [Microscillaceae bacterium]
MFNFLTKTLTKIFGSKHERDLKELLPYVGKINAEWQKLTQVSDDELRAQTDSIRAFLDEKLRSFDEKIAYLRQTAEDDINLDIEAKENLFNQIDKLEDERNKQLEVLLLEVLPQGFAIVKETARRFKENGQLKVTANDKDREFAAKKANVKIDGNQAIWLNRWLAAGNEIVWDMVHYDVQLIGGVVLHQGKISEMATGEGKTLVATLPAFLNALARRGVHIVTVNDYLARRDSEWMGPLFEFHGLRVDCIDLHEPHTEARRKAYLADITYGTNNEFGFDYLRDNMARDLSEQVQRRHHYAMVDEVDSVLVDDARTPLIIAGPVSRGDEHEYEILKPRIQRLVEAQRKLVLDYLNEAKRKFQEKNEKEVGLPLFRAYRGLPKLKPLIKFLSESGTKVLMQKTENYYLQDNQRLLPEADQPLYFTIDEKNNQIDLTEKGIDFITGNGEDPNFFILPDIGTEVARLEADTTLSEEEKLTQKDAIIGDFGIKSQRVHTVQQLLKAYTLFEKEVDYIIIENEVKIVDEQTGRVLSGRRYSDGLHQALEAKENVKIQDATQTYATITLQNYFRMYHKLAGMTGTAETEAGELWDIYKLDVVVIPTNKNTTRKDQNDLVYKTIREKYNAVIEEIARLVEQGRPVLVGTTSVEISELLSRMLTLRKIRHQVLNAKLHQKEAEVVAEAGKSGTVTIATNMAGRGTDIKLTPESRAAGGLAIIGTERHESRRVDRQLRGRSGRQGDPGTSQFFVSLEDNLMRLFGSERIARIMDRFGFEEGEVIQHSMITSSIERAQKKVEENNFGIRKRLLEYDDVMNSQRTIIYKRRKNALSGERLQIDIMNVLYDTCDDIVNNYQGPDNYENFRLEVLRIFGFETKIQIDEFDKGNPNALTQKLYTELSVHYQSKNDALLGAALPMLKQISTEQAGMQEVAMPYTDGKRQIVVVADLQKVVKTEGRELIKEIQKSICLAIIDQEWKEHLRDMDDLKQSVQNAVWEQKDPLMVYKFEGFELFKLFVARVNKAIVTMLLKGGVPTDNPNEVRENRRPRRQLPRLRENKAEVQSVLSAKNTETAELEADTPIVEEKVMPFKAEKVIGRNERVTVKYLDGSIKKDVKYKSVEDDLKNQRCVIFEG